MIRRLCLALSSCMLVAAAAVAQQPVELAA